MFYLHLFLKLLPHFCYYTAMLGISRKTVVKCFWFTFFRHGPTEHLKQLERGQHIVSFPRDSCLFPLKHLFPLKGKKHNLQRKLDSASCFCSVS